MSKDQKLKKNGIV